MELMGNSPVIYRKNSDLLNSSRSKNREETALVDFDSTNNRAFASGLLVSNSEKTNARETSKAPCMTELVLSLVDSTTRISTTDFHALDNCVPLGRANQSPPRNWIPDSDDSRPFRPFARQIRFGYGEKETSVDLTSRDWVIIILAFFLAYFGVILLTSVPTLTKPVSRAYMKLLSCIVVLHGLDFFYYCLTGLSLYVTFQILKKIMEPMRKTLAIYLENNSITSDLLNSLRAKNREETPLVDFDSTNNRACKIGLLVCNSEKTNARGSSKGPCMTEDFDAPDKNARLGRANQRGPIMPNSEKKDTSEGLNGECLSKSVLSLDDSTKRKSFPDIDATGNKAHLVRAYQSAPVVSLSEYEHRGEALKRECITKSILGLEDLQQHFGGRHDDAAKSFCGIHTADSLALVSFEVIKTLPTREQPNDSVSLLSLGRSMLEDCVQQEKSPDLPSSTQIKRVVQRVTKLPRYLGGLTAQSASSSHWPIGLPDGGHIALLDPLHQHTKNIEHATRADQCSSTASLAEKKMVRNTLKRRTLSVIFVENHRHFARICKGATMSLGVTCIIRKHGINQATTVKRIWPFRQFAVGLPDGGHILPLSEKKIVRKTLKRKGRSMRVLSLVDCQQHVDRRWEDAAKNIGAKFICRQLVIHHVSIAKRRQHEIHHWWPFQQDWAAMKRYSLGDERPVEVINLSTHAKLVSRLQLIYISWLGRFSPRPSALPGGDIGGPRSLSLSESPATKNIAQRVRQDQSGSASSDSENERTREQDDLDEINISITKEDILRLFGKMNRQDAAARLSVSISTLKRKCRRYGIGRWKHVRRKRVLRPPDRHGDRNTATACETPSHYVQPGIEGEPVGQNQEANVLTVSRAPDPHGEKSPSPTFKTLSTIEQITVENEMSGQNPKPNEFQPDSFEDLNFQNTEFCSVTDMLNDWDFLASEEEPSLEGHVSESVNLTMVACSNPTPCQSPMPIIPDTMPTIHMMPHLACSEPAPCQEPRPTIPDTMPTIHMMPHLTCSEPAPCQEPRPTILDTMPTIHKMPHLACSEPAPCQEPKPTIPDTMPTIHMMPHLACTEPAPCQQPMPTIPVTLPTIHMMPHLACSKPAPCQEPRPTILDTMPTIHMMPHLAGSELALCQEPRPTIPDTMPTIHMMPHLACSEPAPCQQPMPTIPVTMPTIHMMPHLACFEPAPCQEPRSTIPNMMPTIHMMPHLACSEQALCQEPRPTILDTMPTIHMMPHLACSEPAPCQQPRPTIPDTMPTIHMMPHLACSELAPCQQPMPTIPVTMPTIHMIPQLTAREDMWFVTLKVTYRKKILKFQFPLISGIIELKEEVKKRLKLELGSFDIEYKDEDGDCIFLGCDEDLRNHLQLFSNQVIRLLVVDS